MLPRYRGRFLSTGFPPAGNDAIGSNGLSGFKIIITMCADFMIASRGQKTAAQPLDLILVPRRLVFDCRSKGGVKCELNSLGRQQQNKLGFTLSLSMPACYWLVPCKPCKLTRSIPL